MKKFIQHGALAVLFLTVMAACTEVCDEPPIDDINALYLEFKKDGEDGFTEEELETFYLVRYFIVPGDSLTFPDDTVHYYGNFYESDNRFRISNGIPFSNDSLFYVRYNYGMFFESDTTQQVLLTDITLRGEYIGDCEYENVEKTFRINGDLVNQSASTDYIQIIK